MTYWPQVIKGLQPILETVFAFFLSASALTLTLICIFYIKCKLKVTDHVKRVLLFQGVSIVCTLLLQSAGYILSSIGIASKNVSCALLISSAPIRFSLNLFFSMVLSIIRFYMADRTGRNRLVDHLKIKRYSFASAIMYWLIWIIILACGAIYGIHFSPVGANCAGVNYNQMLRVIYKSNTIICSIVSILFDVKLVMFVRDQNKTHPIRMEAWTAQEVPSRQSNLDDTLKDTVPVISTIISCSLLLGNFFLLALHTFYPLFDSIVIFIGNVATVAHLPLVLTFTVNSQDKKKAPRALPPTGLQYHDPIDNTCEAQNE